MPESSLSQVSISSSLAKIQKAFEVRGWVSCPACAEEWSKLRSCRYLTDSMAVEWRSVCVNCAETLVRMDAIAALAPLPGIEVSVRWLGPKSLKVRVGEKFEMMARPANAYAVFNYAGIKYIATSKGTGQPLRFKREGSEKEMFADNTFELWSKVKWFMNNPTEEENAFEKAGAKSFRK